MPINYLDMGYAITNTVGGIPYLVSKNLLNKTKINYFNSVEYCSYYNGVFLLVDLTIFLINNLNSYCTLWCYWFNVSCFETLKCVSLKVLCLILSSIQF